PSAPEHVTAEIEQFIESFTVKIGIGSGTLLGKKGNTYLVLTNRHVVAENTPVSIRTSDGQTHSGEIIKDAFPKAYDLALLTFESPINYRIPSIADFTPRAGQALIIGGYRSSSGEFQSSRAALEQVLPANPVHRQIDQLVYGGTIRKGMSGGPLIEASGQLIGINSHGHPPASQNLSRVNGSTLTSEELEQLRQLNWGIPIDTVLAQLKPELLLSYQLPSPNTQLKLAKPNWTGWLKDLENRAKYFTVRVDNQTTGGNGSGVIVAKEGNTYTVLTAEHVLDQKGDNHQFSVLTHDGESHVINSNNIRRQPGVDLASFQFESEVNYSVATLANYPRSKTDVVFVAGFPKVGKEGPQWLMSGGTIYEEEQGRFQISNTRIASQQRGTEQAPLASLQASFAQGYDMVYTSVTYRGMSGGPVLDSEGRVVGIHGQAEGEPEEDSSQGVIQLGNSLGIPISTLLPQADKLKINPNIIDKSSANVQLSPLELSKLQDSLLTISVPSSNASAAIWIQRGNQLHRLQRYQQAIDAFEQAIQLSDVNPEYQHLAYFGKA
ncbi:trypsin-like peptidase domain-containing protein, partial [Acaryochloris marina NIES-2412]|uniref:trypsin-like peptidase domain-containing protein n=1 Tax=Acaryochloris marina TaxID=155978 RepID=UPI00405A2E1C